MNTPPSAGEPTGVAQEVPRIQLVDACTDPLWAKLSRAGSLFTSPPWLRAICGTYSMRADGRIIASPDNPLGGVVSIDVDNHMGARRLSLPFCDRADPVLADRACWALLANDLTADGLEYRVRCIDTDTLAATAAASLDRTGEAAWHGFTTTAHPDEIFATLHPSARRNIRAARRHGVAVRISSDLVDVNRFFDLHLALRKRKYRLLAQPREFFERVWSEFIPDNAIMTMLAYLDGCLVAGALFLIWDNVLYYKFGASAIESLAARPNDLLFWTAILWASEHKLRMVDWGLSEFRQPGLIKYKRKWSDLERRIITLTSASNSSEKSSSFSNTLTALTELLTEDNVPMHTTERAGALLYRYFC